MLEQWTLRRLAEWQLAAACLRPQLDQAVDPIPPCRRLITGRHSNPVADGPGLERSRRAPVLATQRASGGRRGARRGATGLDVRIGSAASGFPSWIALCH